MSYLNSQWGQRELRSGLKKQQQNLGFFRAGNIPSIISSIKLLGLV
jgi:hypothetical protein